MPAAWRWSAPLLIFTHLALAETQLSEHVSTNDCVVSVIPEEMTAWPQLCIVSRLESSVLIRSNLHDRNRSGWSGDLYTGLHFGPAVSLHFGADLKDLRTLAGEKLTDFPPVQRTRYLFAQLGNATLGRFRVSAGHIDLPFGLNPHNLPEIYYDTYISDQFWRSPPYGVRLGTDNGTDLKFDFGFSYDKPRNMVSAEGVVSKEQERANSVRLMYDVPALSGTRFILSLMEHSTAERKYGAALINRSPERAVTSVEWVRRKVSDDTTSKDFEQLTRLSIRGPDRGSGVGVFEYEDQYPRHWLTTFAYEHFVAQYLSARGGISYRRARRIDDVNHWVFTVGVQGHL